MHLDVHAKLLLTCCYKVEILKYSDQELGFLYFLLATRLSDCLL